MRFAGRIRGERPIFHRLVKVCYVAGWLNAAMRLIRSCFHLPRRVRLVLTFAMVQVNTRSALNVFFYPLAAVLERVHQYGTQPPNISMRLLCDVW